MGLTRENPKIANHTVSPLYVGRSVSGLYGVGRDRTASRWHQNLLL
jgi:hypothetical protein